MIDIVMIGSSIFEFWGQPKWGNLKISNQAIRSTQSQDWLDKAISGELANLSVARHLLIYCGSNDLIYGQSPNQIVKNVCELLEQLNLLLPNSKLGYFSIMECPQKVAANQQEIINNINLRIKQYCFGKHDYFNFNDFIENNEKWFNEDGLHLTEQAYSMLDTQLNPVINKWINSNKNKKR